MKKKEIKRRIREEMRAEQAEYDERTRRLRERIERGRREAQERERASS
jgi:hypothetical protein